MPLQPEHQAALQPQPLGPLQGRHPPGVQTRAGSALDLHQQQAPRFVEQQIELTPTATPALLKQAPTGGLQQPQRPLLSPVALPL